MKNTPVSTTRSQLFSVCLIVFIDLFGFGLVIPVLPFAAQKLGAGPAALGWLMAAYSLMQFLSSPLFGALSDRYGRRPILLASSLGQSLAMAIMAVGVGAFFSPLTGLLLVFLGRALGGFSAASIGTAYAYIADISDERARTKRMGLLGAAIGLGFTAGPGLGALAVRWGEAAPFVLAALMSLLNFALAWFRLPESLPIHERHAQRPLEMRRLSLKGAWKAITHASTGRWVAANFLFTLAITQLESMFALFMGLRFHFTASEMGAVIAGTGSLMIIVQGGCVGYLSKTLGDRKLASLAAVCITIGFFLFSSAQALPIAFAALAMLAFSRACLQPTLSSLLTSQTSRSEHGRSLGEFQSAASLARAIGPIAGGFLFHALPSAPFSVAGILTMGLTFLVFSALRRPYTVSAEL